MPFTYAPEPTMDKLRNHDRLEDGEQRRLILLAQAGDVGARNTVVECNMRLVFHYAAYKAKFAKRVQVDDLVQSGVFGLANAVRLFDVTRSHQGKLILFVSYATRHIKVKMDEVIKKQHVVHSPHWCHDKLALIAKGRQLTLTANDVKALECAKRAVSGYTWTGLLDGDDQPSIDMVEDHAIPADRLEHDDDVRQVAGLMHRMCERHRLLLTWRFGLDGGGVRTLKQCGSLLGITKERVRQVAIDAIERLRELAYAKHQS